MIGVEQTIYAPPDGNCFAACVASILEVSLDEVPNYHGWLWWDQWIEWLTKRGLTFYTVQPAPNFAGPLGYAILTGKSPRGDWDHCVVTYNGDVVWDPSPHRAAGLGELKEYQVFGVLDPAKIQVGQ